MASESAGSGRLTSVGALLFFLPLIAILPVYARIAGRDGEFEVGGSTPSETFGFVRGNLSVLAIESAVLFVVVLAVIGYLSPAIETTTAGAALVATWAGIGLVLGSVSVLGTETGVVARTLAMLVLGVVAVGAAGAAGIGGGVAGAYLQALPVLAAYLYGIAAGNGYVVKSQQTALEPDRDGGPSVESEPEGMTRELEDSRAREILSAFADATPAAPGNLARKATIRSARREKVFRDVVTTLHVGERTREHTEPRPAFEERRDAYRTDLDERGELSPRYDTSSSFKYLLEDSVERRICPACDGTGKGGCRQCNGSGGIVEYTTLERTYRPEREVSHRNGGVPTGVLTGVGGEKVEQRTDEDVPDEGIHGKRTEVYEVTVDVVSYEYGGERYELFSVDGTPKALGYPTKFGTQYRVVQGVAIVSVAVFAVAAVGVV